MSAATEKLTSQPTFSAIVTITFNYAIIACATITATGPTKQKMEQFPSSRADYTEFLHCSSELCNQTSTVLTGPSPVVIVCAYTIPGVTPPQNGATPFHWYDSAEAQATALKIRRFVKLSSSLCNC